jgi:hypothetical protein
VRLFEGSIRAIKAIKALPRKYARHTATGTGWPNLRAGTRHKEEGRHKVYGIRHTA